MRKTITLGAIRDLKVLHTETPLKRLQQRGSHDKHASCYKETTPEGQPHTTHGRFHSVINSQRVGKTIKHKSSISDHADPLLKKYPQSLLPGFFTFCKS